MTTDKFKHIVILHQPAMQRMAEVLLRNEADAEDAVQDSLLQLWNQRHELDRAVSTEAFCISIVKRRCIDLLRKRHPSVPIDEAALPCQPAPDDSEQRYREVLRLLQKLPPRQQQAVQMKYEEGLDTAEIARRLGITTENLYTTLSRAYAALRALLQKQDEGTINRTPANNNSQES